MRFILAVTLLCVNAFAEDPGSLVNWTTFKNLNTRSNSKWGPALTDIKTHERPSENYNVNDLITTGHEVSHDIHSYLRNKNTGAKRVNAFYVLNDLAAIIEEPNIRKSKVAPYVPNILKGSRYGTYVTGQVEWDDTPLYIFDEWNAYVNGMAVAIDLEKNKLWSYGIRQCFDGPIEFVVYAIALLMAVNDSDPSYLKNNTQLAEFTAWNIERTMNMYEANRSNMNFNDNNTIKYIDNLRKHPDAAKLRAFSQKIWDKLWVYQVLGF
jgi:hypothetical protein